MWDRQVVIPQVKMRCFDVDGYRSLSNTKCDSLR